MEQLMRDTFLYFAKNRSINQLAKRYGLKFGADRFVAGDSIQPAIATVKELNGQNILATLDHLGEFVSSPEEAKESTDYCLRTLDAIQESGVKSHMSLKMTQLGLDISEQLCMGHMREILTRAREYGNFVRIDMEDFSHNEITLKIFKILREEFGESVGLVIQSYLYKSEADVQELNSLHPNLRIVKGAYKEPDSVAYPNKADVDLNYVNLVKLHLLNGNYTAVASHDERIIHQVKGFVKEQSIPNSQFEFQMLYGISTQLQKELTKQGYTVRVYVPYGNDWFGYFMRRLAERPANVGFVMKSMFK